MLKARYPELSVTESSIVDAIKLSHASTGAHVSSIIHIANFLEGVWRNSNRKELVSTNVRCNPEQEAILDFVIPLEFLAQKIIFFWLRGESSRFLKSYLSKNLLGCLITKLEQESIINSGLKNTMPANWNGMDIYVRYSLSSVCVGELGFYSNNEIKKILDNPYAPFYVYKLLTPQKEVFYVGKGEGFRVLQHEKEVFKKSFQVHTNWKKLNKIASILYSGKSVLYQIDSWHFCENSSYLREDDLILLHERANPWLFTNSDGNRWRGKPSKALSDLRSKKGIG